MGPDPILRGRARARAVSTAIRVRGTRGGRRDCERVDERGRARERDVGRGPYLDRVREHEAERQKQAGCSVELGRPDEYRDRVAAARDPSRFERLDRERPRREPNQPPLRQADRVVQQVRAGRPPRSFRRRRPPSFRRGRVRVARRGARRAFACPRPHPWRCRGCCSRSRDRDREQPHDGPAPPRRPPSPSRPSRTWSRTSPRARRTRTPRPRRARVRRTVAGRRCRATPRCIPRPRPRAPARAASRSRAPARRTRRRRSTAGPAPSTARGRRRSALRDPGGPTRSCVSTPRTPSK